MSKLSMFVLTNLAFQLKKSFKNLFEFILFSNSLKLKLQFCILFAISNQIKY